MKSDNWDSPGTDPEALVAAALAPCLRCKHPRAAHDITKKRSTCSSWDYVVAGLPDAAPCGCPCWLGAEL